MTLRLTLFTAILIVVAACSEGDSSAETTTTSIPVVTTSIPVVTASTVSSDVNVATAEALVDAIVDPGEGALDALPWASNFFKQVAMDYREFQLVLNTETLGSSCEAGAAGAVICRARMSDDLSEALGWDSFEDEFRVILGASGEIVGLSIESSDADLEDIDAFWEFVFEVRPELFEGGGACRGDGSDAECAVALLELAEEYTKNEQP